MTTFKDIKISKQLYNAVAELGFETLTPIQEASFSVVKSGKNIVGIAQTGTGKTLAYLLPILQGLKFSEDPSPRVLILVPTRELVLQVVQEIEKCTKYLNIKALGVYGGTNINTQKQAVVKGMDVLVATPGRLYDLALTNVLQLKRVKQLVIDEVDVMLDLGFRFQLSNIFDLLPERRQNIMFSATMTKEIDALINDFFITPVRISIAVSGTPLENIAQTYFLAPNFYTKVNLLAHLLKDKSEYRKALVFVTGKKNADRVFNTLEEMYGPEMGIIHSNKSQNYRLRSIKDFEEGTKRILITTDVMARGLDLDKISHVINFDVPIFPENYMHRIGRTGRAEEEGKAILFYLKKEEKAKLAIEMLMKYEIPMTDFPPEVEISHQLTPEESASSVKNKNYNRNAKKIITGASTHEKKAKNKKVNLGGKYRRELAKKYKKAKTRGDKRQNKRKKK